MILAYVIASTHAFANSIGNVMTKVAFHSTHRIEELTLGL